MVLFVEAILLIEVEEHVEEVEKRCADPEGDGEEEHNLVSLLKYKLDRAPRDEAKQAKDSPESSHKCIDNELYLSNFVRNPRGWKLPEVFVGQKAHCDEGLGDAFGNGVD